MMTHNDILSEIVHLASAGLCADLTEVKKQAIGDIAAACASVVAFDFGAAKDGKGDGASRTSRPTEGEAKDARRKAIFKFVNAKTAHVHRVQIEGHTFDGFCISNSDGEHLATIDHNGKTFAELITAGCGKWLCSRMMFFAMRGAASYYGHKKRLRENRRGKQEK